jgi:hypothetical protein
MTICHTYYYLGKNKSQQTKEILQFLEVMPLTKGDALSLANMINASTKGSIYMYGSIVVNWDTVCTGARHKQITVTR